MAALEWGIPIDEWFRKPRTARATMLATLRAKTRISNESLRVMKNASQTTGRD